MAEIDVLEGHKLGKLRQDPEGGRDEGEYMNVRQYRPVQVCDSPELSTVKQS